VTPGYTSPGSRGTAAILALYVKVGACLVAIGADVGRIVTARGLEGGRLQVDDLLAADRLVALGALLELGALGVAVALWARWYAVVRRNRALLGGREPLGRLRPLWLAVLGLAVVAVVVSWTALGDAQDAGDRQRIDALRAAATALSAAAAALTIAVVASVTRHQEEQADADGLSRAPETAAPPAEGHSDGGLRVVSEERARRRGPEA
jgi:hypothetical protein